MCFRYSEIEQIAVLSVVVLHYTITVLDEPQYALETAQDERKARVLQRGTGNFWSNPFACH